MTARAGMANIILELRAATNTGATDFTVNGVQYWTDDQLQDRLDRNQVAWTYEPITLAPVLINNQWQWFDYYIPAYMGEFFEEGNTADSGWAVRDYKGVAVVAGITINYKQKRISFTADQKGAPYFLDANAYDMWRTAAQIWREKAGFAASGVDWSSDNHTIKAGMEYDHCMDRAKEFEKKAGIRVAKFFRNDEKWRARR